MPPETADPRATAQRLIKQLVEASPDEATRNLAAKMAEHFQLVPMEKILARVEGKNVVAKARTLKVTRQTVYGWLRGISRPNAAQAELLAKLTKYPVSKIRRVVR